MKKIICVLTATFFFVLLAGTTFAQKTIDKPTKPGETTTVPADNTQAGKGTERSKEKTGRNKASKTSRNKAPKTERNEKVMKTERNEKAPKTERNENIEKTQRNSTAPKAERSNPPSPNGTRTAPVERKKNPEVKNRGN